MEFKNSVNTWHNKPPTNKLARTVRTHRENIDPGFKPNRSRSQTLRKTPNKYIKELYEAKCHDLGILVMPDQQSRFFTSCETYFKNRKCTLKELNLGPASANALGRLLVSTTKFPHINVSRNVFRDHGTLEFCNLIAQSNSIVHLDISSNDLTPEGSARVIDLLQTHPSLVSLDLSAHEGLHRNRLGKLGAESISKLLGINELLTHLNLSGTSLGTEGLDLISRGLANNKSLLYLNLSNNPGNYTNLFSSISDLQHLNLSGNRIGNEGSESLARLIGGSAQIRILDISKNEITIKGLVKIFPAVRKNTVLEQLSLDKNDFSLGLSSEFLPFMQGNKVLKSISFNSCNIREVEIAEALKCNKTLLSLSLSGNQIGPSGAKDLALGIISSMALRTLVLSCNKIKNEGGIAIANAFRFNKVLEKLNLKENSLSNKTGQAFCEVMRTNTSLLKLTLDNNSIDPKLIEDMQRNIERNISTYKKALVPMLRDKIDDLFVDSARINYLEKHIRRMEREKRQVQKRIPKHTERLGDFKTREDEKLKVLKEEYSKLRKISHEASKSLVDLQENLRISEIQYNKQAHELSEKIRYANYELSCAEKQLGKAQSELELTRIDTEALLKEYRNELCESQIDQRRASMNLEKYNRQLADFKKMLCKRAPRHQHLPLKKKRTRSCMAKN